LENCADQGPEIQYRPSGYINNIYLCLIHEIQNP
jgi:hypothetical protein